MRWALLGTTALGALLRFPTLDAKSFWEDEAVTVLLVRRGFGEMLSALPASESTPPVYYVLAWLWTSAFGTGEVGIRSLSALAGTAAVPAAYLAGRELVSRRAGLVAAGVVATSPLLVWYAQEARAYALLVLLSGLSLAAFGRALRRPEPLPLAGWAVASGLALATHYFGVFLVAAEAALLVRRWRARRAVLAAVAVTVAAGAALLPLALDQLGKARWIEEIGLGSRAAQIPGIFLVGFEGPAPFLLAGLAGALALVGLALLARAGPGERRGALAAGAVGVFGIAAPLGLALAGTDYLIYKNAIGSVIPLAVLLAGGLATGRAGAAAAAALCALGLAIVLSTAFTPKYHREDWRRVAEALGEAVGPRAVVVTPDAGREPLMVYLDATPLAPAETVELGEIDLVAGARRALGTYDEPRTPRPPTPAPPVPGFAPVERVEGELFTLVRFRALAGRPAGRAELAAAALGGGPVEVLLQRPPAG